MSFGLANYALPRPVMLYNVLSFNQLTDILLLPDNRCRPLLQPSTECKDVTHGGSADGMYPLTATGRGSK